MKGAKGSEEFAKNQSNNNREKTFTVQRCSELITASSKWKDLKSLANKDDVTLEQIVKHIKGYEESRDYSGIYFSNKFRVDQPIYLVGMGFYGPFEVPRAIYNVYIEVSEGNNFSNFTVAKSVHTVEAKQGEIFTVEFLECIYISSYRDYLVKFRLEGPPTFIGDPEKILTKCRVENVTFDFDNGSQQMPLMNFKLN